MTASEVGPVCGEPCEPCLEAGELDRMECAACCPFHGYDIEPDELELPGWSAPQARAMENVAVRDGLL